MRLRKLSWISLRLLPGFIFFIPLALLGIFEQPSFSNEKLKTDGAGPEEMVLYRAIGVEYLCQARLLEIDWDKAIVVASRTYASLLNGRHGGVIIGVNNDEKLSAKQLFFGAQDQLVFGAMAACADQVPDVVEKKVKKRMKELKKNK